MYRIATWNLERPKPNREKTRLALHAIKVLDPDILVLTESSDAVDLPGYHMVSADSFPDKPDEQWVAICSKWPVVKQIPTLDSCRTCCAVVKTPFGKITVYGTIIPYHMAGVNGSRYEDRGYKAWQWHYKDIADQGMDWQRIIKAHPEYPFFVVGDFNQTRDGEKGGYGTIKGRKLLAETFDSLELRCLTELNLARLGMLNVHPKKAKVRRNVDHIAVSRFWLDNIEDFRVGAWDEFTEGGKNMSDHNGVYVDFIP
ncbi:endonuclease/exonuclease/phosphatase family protein [Robertkochia aurantiaca]|uniref:endonuclease/exonuclease/phosphatase family protein n=1 Tax=Robertkochia aurantiaca TaxID=2873700 RepID=UPI001CCB4F6D|nr:endonuclease/exonuclease/phosphatase family protein [Robertkochia sp. 3YJGBD-33]